MPPEEKPKLTGILKKPGEEEKVQLTGTLKAPEPEAPTLTGTIDEPTLEPTGLTGTLGPQRISYKQAVPKVAGADDWWEQTKNIAPALMHGFARPFPETAKGAAEFFPTLKSALVEEDVEEPVPTKGLFGDLPEETVTRVEREQEEAYARPVTDRPLYKYGESLQRSVDTLPDISNTEHKLSTQVSLGVGQVLGQIFFSFVPGVGPFLSAGLAMGPQVHEEARVAREKGATPEQVRDVAIANLPIGYTDFIATMLLKGKGKTVKAWLGNTAKTIRKLEATTSIKYIPKIGLEASKGFGIEGGQESFQRFLSNYAAREIYDDSRTLDSGVWDEGLVGGLVGAITRSGGHITSKAAEASIRHEARKMRKSVQEASDVELVGMFSPEEFQRANIVFEEGVELNEIGEFTPQGLAKIRENADALNNLEEARLTGLTNTFTDLIFKAVKEKDPALRENLKDIVHTLNSAEMRQQHHLGIVRNKINDWEARLPAKHRKDFRKIAKEYIDGNDLQRLEFLTKYGEDTHKVASEVRTYLNQTRVALQQQIARNIERNANLTEQMKTALTEIQDRVFNKGHDDINTVVEQTAEKHKLTKEEEKELNKLANGLVEASEFGKEKYLPNIELGDFVIYNTETKQRVGFAKTRRKAQKRINKGDFDGQNVRIESAGKFKNANRINPMKARKEILAGERNIFEALNAYAQFTSNYLIKAPLLAQTDKMINETGDQFSTESKNTLRDTIDKVRRGQHSRFDEVVDKIVHEKWGFGKNSYTRFLSGVRRFTGRAKFSRIGAPLNNAVTGAINLLSKFERVQIAETLAYLKTEEGQKFIKENNWRLGIDLATDIGMNMSGELQEGKKRLGKKVLTAVDPLTIFRLPEPHIRRIAFVTAYRLALQPGVSEETALRDATLTNAMTAFTYNVANMPAMLQGVGLKTIFQFKSYLGKQAEFFVMLPPAKKLKYTALMLAAGGPRVFIKFMKALPLLGAIGFLPGMDEWEQKSEELLGDFAYGFSGLFGLDVSTGIALDIPQDIPGVIGPSASQIWKLYKNFLGSPTMEQLAREFAGDNLKYVAGAANIWDSFFNIDEDTGAIHDWKTGDYKYNINSNWHTPQLINQTLVALGISNIQKARNYTAEQWMYNNMENQRQFAKTLLRRVRWSLTSSGEIALDDAAQLAELNIDIGNIVKSWGERNKMTKREKFLMETRHLRSIDDWVRKLPDIIAASNILE